MSNLAYQKRWGYKGKETALNGITNVLEQRFKIKGTGEYRHSQWCKMVESYGKEVLGLTLRGHLANKASYVAKQIQKQNGFGKFLEWADLNALECINETY